MLFNSYEFLFLFLPCVFAIHRLLISRNASTAILLAWLSIASLFFYAWWEPAYLALLTTSILLNFGIVQLLKKSLTQQLRKITVILGCALNLALLAYFKYAGFILENLQAIGIWNNPIPQIVLPLAISFFTFQQIAYLVACYQNPKSSCTLLEHIFFISFFPHLIAGPIVYKNELVDQTRLGKLTMAGPTHWQLGLALFTIGMAKKLLLGDNLATSINPLYEGGGPAESLDAWLGSFLCGLQIYFDFSAYSDMALGLAYLFGLRLPINFDSPFKATTYNNFWRRWHITLFRFFRDRVFIPLAGRKPSELKKISLMCFVFFLSGLWHGPAWTYIAWGVLNWIMAVGNDLWLQFWSRTGLKIPKAIGKLLGRTYVFIAFSLTVILFRSPEFKTVTAFIKNFFSKPDPDQSIIINTIQQWPLMRMIQLDDNAIALALCIATLALITVVWHTPNAVRYVLHTEYPGEKETLSTSGWMAVLLGILAWFSIMLIPNSSQFVYFKF